MFMAFWRTGSYEAMSNQARKDVGCFFGDVALAKLTC